MPTYLARRFLWMLPVLFGVAAITFLLMHAVPGGPWDRDKTLAPQVVENLNRRYGLDKPLWEQFGSYIGNLARGNLGPSYIYQDRDVREILWQGLPVTATLGGLAFLVSLGIGIPLGMLAAVKRNSAVDYISVFLATVFAAVPAFVLGILLVIVFSVTWHVLPTGGWGTPKHLIMPVLALATLPTAYVARVTRASVLEVLSQDYVRTAWSKGLSRRIVYGRHVLKNAFIPVFTILGPELAFLITGSFIIEALFSVPGVGRLFVQGVFQRDYGLIMGSVLFYTFVIAVINLIVDVLYAAVDPRVRLT